MIPILYEKTETQFLSNGLGRLTECVSCEVTEERNGIYECEFKYPLSGRFCKEMMENGGVISATHDDNGDRQAFDIYKFSAPIDGIVTFNAHHISYRLNGVIVTPFTASSCAGALQEIKNHSANTNPFSFSTDKSVVATFIQPVPANARGLLAGQSGSILDVYGTGEYEFDMFDVKLHLHRGQDKGVTIRYGKNLSEMTNVLDKSGTYNAIAPYWTNGETTVILPEVYIAVTSATEIYCVPADLSSDFEQQPSRSELREAAMARLSAMNPSVPDENITINFEALWQTAEYEDVAVLQKVSLCDTVSIFFPAIGVTRASAKIIKTVYDTLREKYISMEFGKAKTTLAESILGPYSSSVENLAGGKIIGASIITAANIQSTDGKFLELQIGDEDYTENSIYFPYAGSYYPAESYISYKGFVFGAGTYAYNLYQSPDQRMLKGRVYDIGVRFAPYEVGYGYEYEYSFLAASIIDNNTFVEDDGEFGYNESYGIVTIARVTPNAGKTAPIQKNKIVLTTETGAEIDLYGPGENADVLSNLIPRIWKQLYSAGHDAAEIGNDGIKAYIRLKTPAGSVCFYVDTATGAAFNIPVSMGNGETVTGGLSADSLSVSDASSLHDTDIIGNENVSGTLDVGGKSTLHDTDINGDAKVTGDLTIGNTTLTEAQLQQLLALI